MIISANSFGAVADSTVLSTEAIQKAIDSCAVSGGGTVVLQPGITRQEPYLSKAV